ncbi:MAG: SprB repeat-containing protein [Bacteroidales bacterium]
MKSYKKLYAIGIALWAAVAALTAQDVIITSVSSTPVSCGDGSDGTITVTVTGGIGNYTYLLTKGAIPVETSGPIAASSYTFTGHTKYTGYIVIVSDASGTTADDFDFANITGPNPIQITSYLSGDISCNGANDGTVSVTATGEGGNFIFSLNGPMVQSNGSGAFSNLTQGDYTVTVSDADGCPSTDVTPTLTIANPSPISIVVDNTTDVDCFGDNTGSISISPSGGTPGGAGTGYTYAWTGPNGFTATSEDLINLEAGAYSVTVYDGNLCSSTAGPITLNQPSQLSALLLGTTDVTCNGGNDGTASITPGGGVGSYSFSWDGQNNGLVSSAEDPIDLLADVYDLTLIDGNGCTEIFTSFATIAEPDAFLVTVDGSTDVSCAGGSDGNVDISVNGGTAPLTFSWVGTGSGYTSADEDPMNMPADSYDLTVTDANGCSELFPDLITLTAPPSISAVLNSSTNVACFGDNTGRAQITVSGGTFPYVINWTGDVSGFSTADEDPMNLVADVYDLEITDDNGCTRLYNNFVTISEPAELNVVVDNVTHVLCNGANTGAIAITPSGGTPVYSYAWTGPNGFSSSSQDLTNLEAGDYSLILTDARGCNRQFIDLVTVNENAAILGSFTLSHISCNGGSDGAINVTLSEAHPPTALPGRDPRDTPRQTKTSPPWYPETTPSRSPTPWVASRRWLPRP